MSFLYDPSRFSYTPLQAGWNLTNSAPNSPWWKNLLKGTGTFFLNSLTNTVNASQAGNPYLPANQNAMNLAPLVMVGVVVYLLTKKR